MDLTFSTRKLLHIYLQVKKDRPTLLGKALLISIVEQVLLFYNCNYSNVDNCVLERVNVIIDSYIKKFIRKIKKCHGMVFFEKKEAGWLDHTNISLPNMCIKKTNIGPGRPSSTWTNSSERSKRRKASLLAAENTPEKLLQAAALSAYGNKDKRDFSYVTRKIISSPSKPKKMRAGLKQQRPTPFSPEMALSLVLATNQTRDGYQIYRNKSKNQGADIFPTVRELGKAKLACYPTDIKVTDIASECSLYSLIDHTISRLLMVIKEPVLALAKEKKLSELKGILYCKYGFDGASGQSIYKQKFTHSDVMEARHNEATLFSTSMVPLRLVISGIPIWVNLAPSSTTFCRPIRLQYIKETKEVLRAEEQHIEEQINNLGEMHYNIPLDDGTAINIVLTCNMALTMLDGKATNALTNTSSTLACNICGATSKYMNDISTVTERTVNETALKYGLSTLHCWIRFFEYILHIGYRIDIKKWQARKGDDKEAMKKRKRQIQEEMLKDWKLEVDVPKVNSGNSNDGNTARVAFGDPEKFSRITKVDCELIKKCSLILSLMASGLQINPVAFKKLCHETAELHVKCYPWYYMPPTIHKVLIHGDQVINKLLLPIGQYSEEAQESLNKVVRNARLKHARKISREVTMVDQIHYLLQLSDPVISTLRAEDLHRKRKKLSPEMLAFLQPEAVPDETSSSSSECDTDSDSEENWLF